MSLPNEQRVAIREKLVTCLTTESVTDVRKKVGDAVAEIARQYTDNGMRFDVESGMDSSDVFGFSQATNGQSCCQSSSRPASPLRRVCARLLSVSSPPPPASSESNTRMLC